MVTARFGILIKEKFSVEQNDKNHVLLTSVCQPFGEKHGDSFGVSYEGTHQILWAQGIFRPRSTTTQWGIDFIAENLDAPAVTLHYPSIKQFIKEIKKGYEYIGIAFVVPTFHKIKPMVEAIRKYAPNTKIVLGGYGTIIPKEELALYSDYICIGEGVAFMRNLLEEPPITTYKQPLIVKQSFLYSLPILAQVGYIFAGLGCPNGCDFCVTSHYFKREHLKLLPTGEAIANAIKDLQKKSPGVNSIWISDEDFLIDPKRAGDFLEEVRKMDKIPSLSIFASMRALSRFKVEELVEMGIDWIWIGFEAKKAGYGKMEGGDFKEKFAELKRHGINVMASMILGFDYQTPEIIQEEFDELMSYNPTSCQFLIYGPALCTPAYEKYNREKRLLNIDYRLQDGFNCGIAHPHIGPEEMSKIQRSLYHQEFKKLGPSVYRTISDWYSGYMTLKDHSNLKMRAKGKFLGEKTHNALTTFPVFTKYYKENPDVLKEIHFLGKEIENSFGKLCFKNRVFSKLLPLAAGFTNFRLKYDLFQQPKLLRYVYGGEGKSKCQSIKSMPKNWGTVG